MPDFLADERGALTEQLGFRWASLLGKLDCLDDPGRGARRAVEVLAGDHPA